MYCSLRTVSYIETVLFSVSVFRQRRRIYDEENGRFSGILAGEPTYPGRYYPDRVLSQPLRNLPGKVRNPDVRRTSETLRFRCSGPIWQRVWISAGGRGRSGDTGTDGRLALPGNRGLPAKKRKLSFEAGLHDSEWSNVCSMENY